MNRLFKLLKLFSFILPILILTACQDEVSHNPHQVVIVMNKGSEPAAGFDPAHGWGAGEHVHKPLIQSTLTITKDDLTIGFDLVTSMDYDSEKLLWTIKLRPDVYFSDGTKLTAEDVAFTYNLVKEQSPINDLTMLEKAYVKDADTVIFQMNKAFSPWPYTMAHIGIVPKELYNQSYGQKPIGSGPYLLSQWDKGQQVILEPNPNYYGTKPLIEKVVILFMAEDAAFAAVQAKQVDASYTLASYSQQSIQDYDLLSVDSVDNRGINLPCIPYNGDIGNDFTADLAVRKALNVGIDRQGIIDKIFYGQASIAHSVADYTPWQNSHADSLHDMYDFEKAKVLFEESGWRLNENQIREKNGVLAELNVLYPIGDGIRQAMAAELSNQFRKLGIKSSFEGLDWNVAYYRAKSQPLVWGWGNHSPMEMYNIYHTAPNSDFARYSPYQNEEVDDYMDQALAEADFEKSLPYWKKAQDLINADLPWLWILNTKHLYFVRQGLQIPKQKIHPHGHGWAFVDNLEKWTWSKP